MCENILSGNHEHHWKIIIDCSLLIECKLSSGQEYPNEALLEVGMPEHILHKTKANALTLAAAHGVVTSYEMQTVHGYIKLHYYRQ